MKIERAIEILNPEHREAYDDLEEVNEACRMGMKALACVREIGGNRSVRTLPEELRTAAEMLRRGINTPAHRARIKEAADVLDAMLRLCGAVPAANCGADACEVIYPDDDMTRRSGLLEEE